MRFCLEGGALGRMISGEWERRGRVKGEGGTVLRSAELGTEHNMSEQNEPTRLDEQAVRDALKVVKDPEVGISIIDLGLVYDVEIDAGKVEVKMTLTSPGCPVGPQIMQEADETVRGLAGVKDVRIELVWEPYWTPERINPKVRAYLGM